MHDKSLTSTTAVFINQHLRCWVILVSRAIRFSFRFYFSLTPFYFFIAEHFYNLFFLKVHYLLHFLVYVYLFFIHICSSNDCCLVISFNQAPAFSGILVSWFESDNQLFLHSDRYCSHITDFPLTKKFSIVL
ncbi:hypothetical protein CSKR_201260 [Clonorchis sinensis]|uniref:Uncharacterized protein n=1 Tax=Clonorchis sinensis TaxID=79923 RepID=A0A8T1MMU8_CLOSI|nr:hypothetical protein CSKR_201260 [Clonorchis sinensis]